jgi:adenylosuccinate lyase
MIERYSRPAMKEIWTDEHKFSRWLDVEIAVCEAWAEKGVIPQEAIPKIKEARFDMKRFEEILKVTHHDMTALLGAVAETLGEESRFIHLGLTTNDVWDTATSLQLVEAADILAKDIAKLTTTIKDKALQHKHTIMVGRTHGVHAEPITFGLKLALWTDEMKRNAQRLAEAKKVISVGKFSGAVGTHATVPPDVEEIACRKLGLTPAPVSNQVLQRDRHAQFVTTLAIIASSLEKFALEMLEAEEPFEEGQTGSSAMPHKRNPELCERICGLARLIRGNSMTSMENVALWHERDISHSSTERIILPDSCLALDYVLNLFDYIMTDLNVYPDRMKQNLELTRGLVFSQRVLLALIDTGLNRQEAYKMVQRNAMKTWKEGGEFLNILEADAEVTASIPPGELRSFFNYDYYLKHIDEIFNRLG